MRRGDGAGVDEQDPVALANHGNVEVAEHDDVGARQLGDHRLVEEVELGRVVRQADVAVLERPRLIAVFEADHAPPKVEDLLAMEARGDLRRVHVPDHRGSRRDGIQSVEDVDRHEVARVEDRVDAVERSQELVRQSPEAGRDMRVGDEADPHASASAAVARTPVRRAYSL